MKYHVMIFLVWTEVRGGWVEGTKTGLKDFQKPLAGAKMEGRVAPIHSSFIKWLSIYWGSKYKNSHTTSLYPNF